MSGGAAEPMGWWTLFGALVGIQQLEDYANDPRSHE